MAEALSVHDNFIYGYVVACDAKSIALCTQYPYGRQPEYTDVLFTGVRAHHFEHVLDGNILFGIEAVDPEAVLQGWPELFTTGWRYIWPLGSTGDPVHLLDQLRGDKVFGYLLSSSYGMSGWVLAQQMVLKPRDARCALYDFNAKSS